MGLRDTKIQQVSESRRRGEAAPELKTKEGVNTEVRRREGNIHTAKNIPPPVER